MDDMLPAKFELPWQAPRIAVLEIRGQIGVQVRGPQMVRTIKGLREDSRIKAVVLDIESPGGSAPVSDSIRGAVARLAKKKPTIAFVMSGALSGGYLIAAAASKIVAVPTSLVGSIGVIFIRPVVRDLLERVGVRIVMTHEGKLKSMFQPWSEPTPEEQQKVQALTEEYYNWFVKAVADARGMPEETVRGYATGEVFSGQQAKGMGLIDELGDMEAAIDMAAEMGKTPKRLQYVRVRRPLLERIMARGGGGLADAVLARIEDRLYPRIEFR